MIKENTMEAFKNAENNGFEGIEFDVRTTKDGKLVVIHDAMIDRVSNGSGFVKDYTHSELLKYNFGSKEVPSKISLLEDVLKEFPNMIKLVELKGKIDIDTILPLVDDKTCFISFDTTYIKSLKKKHPKLKVGILNYVLNSDFKYNLDIICILDSIANDDIVMKFLKKGIKVFIYGIVGKINYQRDYENLYYLL